MWKLKRQCPRCLCHLLVAVLTVALVAVVSSTEITDFVSTNILADGEVETRIYYKGVSAKETSVGKGSPSGIKFRQLTDGKHLIQLIYDDDNQLRDCEFGHQRDQVKSFLFNFKHDLSNLIATSNISVESLDDRPLPEEFHWLNYTNLREVCKLRHRELKRIAHEAASHENKDALLMERSSRKERSLLIVPGTLWCGDSHSANTYTQLGTLSNTDRCCRRHDHCKREIPGFSKKYNYLNASPFTLSHCKCDRSFRACLKMVGTSDANLVGKLFFNVVQTKCFVLKPNRKCVRSSWWGKCEKYKITKQAILRDNLPY